MAKHGVSERRACKVIGQSRTAQRYEPKSNDEKKKLRDRVIDLAENYGRYGYRQITYILNNEGWRVGKDAVVLRWGPCISSPAVLGKMATANRSTVR